MNAPILSVIVCTYNRANLLDNCLASLSEQDLNSELYEIIVVDNNSKDNTSDVVSKYMGNDKNIRYVIEENQGLSYARNRGSDEASSQYLVYIDDDAIAPPEYLSNILEIINRYDPDICGGPVYPYYTCEKPRWFKDEYEIRKYEETSGYSKTCRISGSNYVIKKPVLKEMGMFDPELGIRGEQIGLGEDAKVLNTYRNRTPESEQKVYYVLECYVRHYVPQFKMTIRYIMMRSYLSGRMSVITKKKKATHIFKNIIYIYNLMLGKVVSEIKSQGVAGADYIYVCSKQFFILGLIIEWFHQLFGKRAKFISCL
tara:strand:- start:2600 stop:3538 length:939 start_codon:yes stop_codon:yes gene_type:complete